MNSRIASEGVSIITCTKRQSYIKNVFRNYSRQSWPKKELIIILNNNQLNLNQYREKAKRYPNISIFKMPEQATLGQCLNVAVSKTKYNYVAKFDDDDFYGRLYIRETMHAFARTKADVVGKLTIFTYLEHRKLLLLRFPNMENKYVHRVGGGTISFRKRIFKTVTFPNRSIGEDVAFQRKCRNRGFKIYSTSRFHFVGIRRKNNSDHTWRVSDQQLIRNSRIIATTTDYRAYSKRPK